MLINTISYCNPFSLGYKQSCKNFLELPLAHKIFTIASSIFAIIITLPFLGWGGIAVFRLCTDKLSNKASDNNSDKSTRNAQLKVLDTRGLYLVRDCMCSLKIKRLGTSKYNNIVMELWRNKMECGKCETKHPRTGTLTLIINGLNHKISYEENINNTPSVRRKVQMNKNEKIIYPLNSFYAYFQIDILK